VNVGFSQSIVPNPMAIDARYFVQELASPGSVKPPGHTKKPVKHKKKPYS
jgi:hypothetical protein